MFKTILKVKSIAKRVLSVNWVLSLKINLYYFEIVKAIKFPILVGYGVRIAHLGDKHTISIPSKFGALCFGLKRGPFALGNSHSFWWIGTGARLTILGTCRMSKGVNMKLFDNAELVIGDGFTSNADLIISCASKIEFGEDTLIGWNVTIMDNDGGHTIMREGLVRNFPRPITIGNHVWLSSYSSILKGSIVPDGSIVGQKASVAGLRNAPNNCVIIGNPASVISSGVKWNH